MATMAASPSPLSILLLVVYQSLLLLARAQSYWNLTVGSTLAPLGPNSSLASPSGDFAFGFRPLGSDPSSLFLLAIWFDGTSPQTVVWFAKNGSDPVQAPAQSTLQLTLAGQLSLFGPTGLELWTSGPTKATHAALLDSGNLVLDDGGGSPLWQSFDAPTDTLLPGQFLREGYDLLPKLTDSDYSIGRFTLVAQNDGNLVLYPAAVPTGNFYKAYWAMNTSSGTQLVFDSSSGNLYYLLENNTQLSIASTAGYAPTQYYRRATLDPDGILRTYVRSKDATSGTAWSIVGRLPADGCSTVQLACGSNALCKSDSSQARLDCQCPAGYSFFDPQREYKGCKPDFAVQPCDDADNDTGFDLVEVLNSDWPGSDYEHYTPITDVQCGELCMSDCFCAGVVVKNADCWKLRLPMRNGRQGNSVVGKSLLKVARSNASSAQQSPPIAKTANRSQRTLILVLAVLLGGSLVALMVTSFCFRTNKRSKKIQISPSMKRFNLRAFTYEELEDATEGFSEELGRGAFGIVYKGTADSEFQSGIAVKKLDRLVNDNESEFMNEVRSIGQTHHKNLVKLFGFCNEGTHRMLVYEYLGNGSLTSFLFGSARPSWDRRARIATGIAKGLVYLHEECSSQIIHCDIKPQNILLGEKFEPKISDFGLAKLLLADQTRTNTGIRGTKGYVAPEWFKNSAITAKVDVYSFGVVLLEIICCRRNIESEAANKEAEVLSYWAYDCFRAERLDLLVEGDEEMTADMRRVEQFIMVAIWCVQEEPSLRPSMQKVGQMLEGAITVFIPPDPSSNTSSVM